MVVAVTVPRLGRFHPLLVTASGAALAAVGLCGTEAGPDLGPALNPYFAAGGGLLRLTTPRGAAPVALAALWLGGLGSKGDRGRTPRVDPAT